MIGTTTTGGGNAMETRPIAMGVMVNSHPTDHPGRLIRPILTAIDATTTLATAVGGLR